MTELLWQPDEQAAEASLLGDYMRYLDEEGAGYFADYDALWQWSVSETSGFWASIWDFADIIGERGGTAYEHDDNIRKARFFPEARLNYAENMLRYQGAEEAIIFTREDGKRSAWTHDELLAEVSRLQQALRAHGVGKGDRVAGIVPNTPQAIAFMLATASLGAIWSSCSPDFGFAAAMDRLDQIAPKILVCANGYLYNGKNFSSLALGEALFGAMASVEKIVLFDLLDSTDDALCDGAISWADFIAPYEAGEVVFEAVAFDHPDPSIYTVLTAPSETAGTANIDFVIFPERWSVAENTFRPPWYHRNIMSEFMGLIAGQYDAKEEGFVPGGVSLHNMMLPHGPDADAFEKASKADLKPVKITNTLAFMFETRFPQHVSQFAAQSAQLQDDYIDCWAGIGKKFDGTIQD